MGSGSEELSEACEVGPREFRADIRMEVERTWKGEGEPWLSVGDGEGRRWGSPKDKGKCKVTVAGGRGGVPTCL